VSVAEDVPMTPIKPDSTGGAITEYSASPLLPKGITLNKLNGTISGTPSDTLLPTRYIITATGPGGMGTDTITFSVGTVAFNYGSTGTFTFEKGSTDLNTTPISPSVLAGTFTQYFVSPSPDSLTIKTGLKFNAQTGQISGVPSVLTSTTEVPTPATFRITGISTANKATAATVSIFVNDKKPDFAYTYGGSFTVGTSVGTLITPAKTSVSGNIIKYRLAPTSAALPTGLALDSLTGKITGTPTAANSGNIIIRGLNTGGYQDVTFPLNVSASAVAPQVYYMMSLYSGDIVDTLCPRINSGNTIYLTKNDNVGGLGINFTPVATAGQVGTFSIAPAFTTGIANEALTLTTSNGAVSGTPGQFSTNGTPSHTLTINNAAVGGPTGSFTMNIVANAPFFTYNSTGKGGTLNNIFYFVQGQQVDVANGGYPGYTTELSPVNGSGVVSYSIFPAATSTAAFSTTGLTFNTTTGAISGTPTTNTSSFGNYNFWDYIVQGKKADGSFTLYKIRLKLYANVADWSH
jgi:hypothetical protein